LTHARARVRAGGISLKRLRTRREAELPPELVQPLQITRATAPEAKVLPDHDDARRERVDQHGPRKLFRRGSGQLACEGPGDHLERWVELPQESHLVLVQREDRRRIPAKYHRRMRIEREHR